MVTCASRIRCCAALWLSTFDSFFIGFDRQVRPRGHVFHDGLSSLQRQSFSVWPKIWPKTESKAKSSLTNPAKLQNNSVKHRTLLASYGQC